MRIPFAEIELDPVQLRETGKRQRIEIGDVFAIALGEQRQHIVAAIVPRPKWRMRIAHRHHAKFRKRRRRREPLVRINVVARRMINRQQLDLIEINRFFHRLEETEAEHAVAAHLR